MLLHLRRGPPDPAVGPGLSVRGTLRVDAGEGPLRAQHDRLMRTALRRGDGDPEAALEGAALEGDYRPETLAYARGAWLERMRREHHSAAVFSQMLPQLMDAGATLDTKTAVLRMAMEELRHAGLCGGVVRLLGAEPSLETELMPAPLPLHEKATPRERALRNVLFVGVNETIAVALLTEERELTREPAIAAVLEQLVADEVGHAKLGWTYLAETWPTLDAAQRARTDAYLPYAFAYLEESLMGPIARLRYDDARRDELNALGLPAPQDLRELFYAAMQQAVLAPLDAQGLAASEGWAARAATRAR